MKILIKGLFALFLLAVGIWFAGTQPLLHEPKRVTTPEVNPQELESDVRFISETLPRRIGIAANLAPTVFWIERRLAKYATNDNEKSYRQSYSVKNETIHNVLMDFAPDNKDVPEDIIVIGAHYDTAHGFPGADDNATGVAALLELAKMLSKNRNKLTRKVQLAFYALEEPPYFRTDKMGSFVHAASLKKEQQKVKMMLSLDMLAYFSDDENSQTLPFPLMDKVYPTTGNFIAIVANLSNMLSVRTVKSSFKSATTLPTYSFNAPAFVPGIDFSDHLNFWYHDYPAVMITDTSFNRNKNYHTKLDTVEKLDFVKMAEVVKALYQTAIDLSNDK